MVGGSCTLSLKLMTNGVLIFDKSSHIGLANLGPGEIFVDGDGVFRGESAANIVKRCK